MTLEKNVVWYLRRLCFSILSSVLFMILVFSQKNLNITQPKPPKILVHLGEGNWTKNSCA